jgi:hypothetical protein
MLWRAALVLIALVHSTPASAQSANGYPPPDLGPGQKFRFFTGETFQPKTLVAGAFNAGVSQAYNSQPDYGVGTGPYFQRFGACTTDVVTQNFFVDFAMASALHQQTRYVRRGTSYGGIWRRSTYAVGRAFFTRTDRGALAPNFANFTGTALSVGLSNAYYPPASRTVDANGRRYSVAIISGAFINLFPEFWPDFKGYLQRHHLYPRSW